MMKFFLYTDKEIPNLFSYYTYFSKELHSILYEHRDRTLDPQEADIFITCFSNECHYCAIPGILRMLGKPEREIGIHEIKKLCIYRNIAPHIVFYRSDFEDDIENIVNIPYSSYRDDSIIFCPPQLHDLNYLHENSERDILCSFKGTLNRVSECDNIDHRFEIINTIKNANKNIIIESKDSTENDYKELLSRSVFGLVIEGDLPWSYRLTEVINSGAIPIIIDPNTTQNRMKYLPFEGMIDYSCFSIIVKRDELNNFFSEKIHQISDSAIQSLRDNLRDINNRVFRDRNTQVNFFIDSL